MPHSADIAQQVIGRLRRLQEFTVRVPVNSNWMPNGPVPFNIKIQNGVATVTLPALNLDEARSKAIQYFESSSGED